MPSDRGNTSLKFVILGFGFDERWRRDAILRPRSVLVPATDSGSDQPAYGASPFSGWSSRFPSNPDPRFRRLPREETDEDDGILTLS